MALVCPAQWRVNRKRSPTNHMCPQRCQHVTHTRSPNTPAPFVGSHWILSGSHWRQLKGYFPVYDLMLLRQTLIRELKNTWKCCRISSRCKQAPQSTIRRFFTCSGFIINVIWRAMVNQCSMYSEIKKNTRTQRKKLKKCECANSQSNSKVCSELRFEKQFQRSFYLWDL